TLFPYTTLFRSRHYLWVQRRCEGGADEHSHQLHAGGDPGTSGSVDLPARRRDRRLAADCGRAVRVRGSERRVPADLWDRGSAIAGRGRSPLPRSWRDPAQTSGRVKPAAGLCVRQCLMGIFFTFAAASAGLVMVSFSTPLSKRASTLPGSMLKGRLSERENLP